MTDANSASMKRHTAFRLSDGALALLGSLSERLGLSRASVIELAVRRLADAEGVPLPRKEPAHADEPEDQPDA